MGVGFGEEVSFSVSSPLLGKLVGLQYSSCLWLLWFIPAGEWHNPCLVLGHAAQILHTQSTTIVRQEGTQRWPSRQTQSVISCH